MSISADLLDHAIEYGRLIEYDKNETIHSRGEQLPGLSIVYTGQVAVGNYGLDGRYQLTAILRQGDTFGEFTLFANLPRTHNAEAFEKTSVIQLSVAQYHRFVKAYPDVEQMLLKSLAKKLHTALERLDDIQRLPSQTRLAKVLFNMSQQEQTLTLKLKQNECAQLIGVSVLSAHKSLKKLEQEGLISTAYGLVTINDIDVLRAWLQAQSSILMVTGYGD